MLATELNVKEEVFPAVPLCKKIRKESHHNLLDGHHGDSVLDAGAMVRNLELEGVKELFQDYDLRETEEVACVICGKHYKSKVCVKKHLWEHSVYWDMFDGLKKQQRVLSIQAAIILSIKFNPSLSQLLVTQSSTTKKKDKTTAATQVTANPTSRKRKLSHPIASLTSSTEDTTVLSSAEQKPSSVKSTAFPVITSSPTARHYPVITSPPSRQYQQPIAPYPASRDFTPLLPATSSRQSTTTYIPTTTFNPSTSAFIATSPKHRDQQSTFLKSEPSAFLTSQQPRFLTSQQPAFLTSQPTFLTSQQPSYLPTTQRPTYLPATTQNIYRGFRL